MMTAEIILNIQDNLRTDIIVDGAICTIDNTVLSGCYRCTKGAQAQVNCISSKRTQAGIECPTTSFTIPCDQKGVRSVLHFSFSEARIHETCKVSCGTHHNQRNGRGSRQPIDLHEWKEANNKLPGKQT
ncbi:hypothetical protein ANCDUO_05357 [Ancylostoma duodenale]|uniref:Phlebovirus glycoprotein G2 fusion domain-containing protein n=1 Tax=Ancylostoma duodenale TaxID=51022 RepID=A0A0C2GST0_9BILA|nr:hypothetical protein ANCDUO_05357 [Ancylostoma duodenale]